MSLHKHTHTLDELKSRRKKIINANEKHNDTLKLTDKIALWITDHVGTFGFFMFCILLTFLPLVYPQAMTLVQFVSSAFLQLVLLPLIMLGQNLQSKHAEIRAESDYEINVKAEQEIETVLKHLENQNETLIGQNQKLMEIIERLEKNNITK